MHFFGILFQVFKYPFASFLARRPYLTLVSEDAFVIRVLSTYAIPSALKLFC